MSAPFTLPTFTPVLLQAEIGARYDADGTYVRVVDVNMALATLVSAIQAHFRHVHAGLRPEAVAVEEAHNAALRTILSLVPTHVTRVAR